MAVATYHIHAMYVYIVEMILKNNLNKYYDCFLFEDQLWNMSRNGDFAKTRSNNKQPWRFRPDPLNSKWT